MIWVNSGYFVGHVAIFFLSDICSFVKESLYLHSKKDKKSLVTNITFAESLYLCKKNQKMPVTKNALIRYYHLDKLLSDSHHYYDRKDLTEKVNDLLAFDGFKTVEKRTIEKDIVNMQDAPFNAPIEEFRWNGKNCVAYGKRSFSLHPAQSSG